MVDGSNSSEFVITIRSYKNKFKCSEQRFSLPNPPVSGYKGFAQLPVWRLGFRLFYLLAAGFAALAIPLWTARYSGALQGMIGTVSLARPDRRQGRLKKGS